MIKNKLKDEQAWIILNGISNVGPITLDRLLGHFGNDIMKIFEVPRQELLKIEGVGATIADSIVNWEKDFNLEEEEKRMQALGVTFINRGHEGFPLLLKEIYDTPIGLYALGKYRPSLKTIAIVGSRRSTLYGLGIAKRLGSELAKLGFCVISGMARGIDSAAHEGALEAGGPTAAVLGNGVDIVYPPENKKLYDRIREQGVVLSEFHMARRADKRTFPMRNRIVSGMAQAVIVVETNSNGGSMITASMAAEQGRHVFAVPGRIDQTSSKGCHDLIRNGASLLTKVDDILEELNYLSQMDLNLDSGTKTKQATPQGLSEQESQIFRYLSGGTIASTDTIAKETALSIQDAMSALLMLELKRIVVKRADGTFEAYGT